MRVRKPAQAEAAPPPRPNLSHSVLAAIVAGDPLDALDEGEATGGGGAGAAGSRPRELLPPGATSRPAKRLRVTCAWVGESSAAAPAATQPAASAAEPQEESRAEAGEEEGDEELLEGEEEEEEEEEERSACSDEEEEDEEEATLLVDEDGRVPVVGDGAAVLDYSFRAFPGLVQALHRLGAGEEEDDRWLGALLQDCEVAFTARAAKTGEEYSAGETFWLPANAEPVTSLEQLAMVIFRLHAGSSGYDPNTSGAEWWTQVIDPRDDIGWHWDRDYALEEEGDTRLHPHIATVTYLSDVGAPTLILECREEPQGEPPFCLPFKTAHWSRPRLGRHICFDGRWLHAAPSELMQALREGGDEPAASTLPGKRYTFLVNIWLNHQPTSAVPYGSGARVQLGRSIHFVMPADGPPKSEVVRWYGEESCGDVEKESLFQWPIGADGEGSAEESEDSGEEAKGDGCEPKGGTDSAAPRRRKSTRATAVPARDRRTVHAALPLALVRQEAALPNAALPDSFSMRLRTGSERNVVLRPSAGNLTLM